MAAGDVGASNGAPGPRPPGPPGLPLLGNLLDFGRDPLGFLTDCARRYGDVVRYRAARVTSYLLNDPDYIESVLVTNSGSFAKGRLLRALRSSRCW